MLDITEEKVWEECVGGFQAMEQRLSALEPLRRGYTSPFFKSESGEHSEERIAFAPENHAYGMVRFYVPNLAFNSPRIRLNSRVYGTDQAVTEMQYAINTWVLEHDYGEFLIKPCTEHLFAPAITLTTREDHPTLELEEGVPAKRAVKSRISPNNYLRDPASLEGVTGARFQGHRYPRDLEDLEAEAEADLDLPEEEREGWILEAVKGLGENAGIDEYRKMGDSRPEIPNRKEVILVEVWYRDYEDENHPGAKEGFFGTLLTLGVGTGDDGESSAGAVFVKDPKPFFGHPDGPYTCVETFFVPDDPYGLAMLVATEGQARDLNRHARGSSDAAARYKRLILVNNSDPNFAELVREGEHDLVLPVEGLEQGKVIEVEIGGITEQNLAYLQLARERLDRVSGMTDIQRGMATGSKTASEAVLAEQNADIGVDFARQRWLHFVRKDLEKVLYLFWKDPKMRVLLGPEAADELNVATVEDARDNGVPEDQIQIGVDGGVILAPGQKLTFAGGEDRLDFSELALEIEPMSTERTTQAMQQRRMMEMFQLVATAGQMDPVMPWVRWQELMNKMGDAMNVPDLGNLIDFDMVSKAPAPAMSPAGENPVGVAKVAPPMGGAPQGGPMGAGFPGMGSGGQLSALQGAQ